MTANAASRRRRVRRTFAVGLWVASSSTAAALTVACMLTGRGTAPPTVATRTAPPAAAPAAEVQPAPEHLEAVTLAPVPRVRWAPTAPASSTTGELTQTITVVVSCPGSGAAARSGCGADHRPARRH